MMGSDQHMMEGMHGHMLALWAVVALIAVSSLALFIFFRRPAHAEELRLDARPVSPTGSEVKTALPQQSNTRDTLFVLPDISGYTRFISLNRFAMGHAQYIVFELLNAIIEATADKLELLKLEGDAALFIADANTVDPHAMGQTIINIFRNFDRRKKHLAMSNFCRCAACRHIGDLDIKIFVHRGEAVHFRFRGTNDVFGTEPIVLHRMMKNQVSSRRYVMITSAAARIALPIDGQVTTTMLDVEGLDKISASVLDIPYSFPSGGDPKAVLSNSGYWSDLLGKLSHNVSTIWTNHAGTQKLRGDEQ